LVYLGELRVGERESSLDTEDPPPAGARAERRGDRGHMPADDRPGVIDEQDISAEHVHQHKAPRPGVPDRPFTMLAAGISELNRRRHVIPPC
jgi:hypothetical protein